MTIQSKDVLPPSRLLGLFRYTMLLPWLVLVACLLASLLLWNMARQSVWQEARVDFDSRAHQASYSVEQRMKTYEQVLRGAEGLFAAYGNVDHNAFSAYVNSLDIRSNYHGMQSLGYVRILPPAKKGRHIVAVSDHGLPESTAQPEWSHDINTEIVYVEPYSEYNQRVLGYDMFSDKAYSFVGNQESGIRRTAMAQARDTGEVTLSARVSDQNAQVGFLMFYPVYKRGAMHDTLSRRRANIIGWVYGSFRMDEMMGGILGEAGSDVDVEIFDGKEMSERAILFDPDSKMTYGLEHAAGRTEPLFLSTNRLNLDGYYWTVTVRSLDGFEKRLDSDKPKLAAYAGVGASLLLALLTWLLVYGRIRATQDAREISRSEERLSAVIDTAMDAVVEMDSDGVVTSWNHQAERIFGWRREEAIGRTLHEIIIPPHYRVSHIDGLGSIAGTVYGPALDSRVEMVAMHRDGREFPIELAITRITLEGAYRFASFIRDITERKQAEESMLLSEQRFRVVSEAAGEYLWETDANMIYTFVSSRSADVKGYAPEELMGRALTEFMPEADVDSVNEVIGQSISARTPFKFQRRDITRTGGIIWEEVSGLPVFDGNGEFCGLRGAGLNITERKLAEDELRLASMVYENSSEAMMIADEARRIIAVNPAFEKMTGYAESEVIGKRLGIFSCGQHDQDSCRQMWTAINTDGCWHGEMSDKRKNGETYVQLLSINTIRDGNGSVHRYVALFSDITRKKESEELIWRQANFDTLTGLPNRRMFSECLEREVKKTLQTGHSLALMFIDLDRFKEINDTLGHDMGDVLLKETAQRLSSCVRTTDIVARLGGDEFTVIMSGLEDHEHVEVIAQDILLRLAEPFRLGGEMAYVSASVGITFYPEDAASIEELLKNADQAMYVSKNKGRNRYHYFTPSMQEDTHARLRLINHLHAALAEGQFQVHYQPIVELSTGAIHKAEALIRWQHPEYGLVSPAEFIPIAEEIGLIGEIGDWVFRQAACQVAQWRESHHAAFQISVNKSPVQFLDEGEGHASWLEYMQTLGLPGQSIAIEITEGILLEGNAAVTEKLLKLRNSGIQVSLDDFGTGYSSLSYLRKFHIDFIKIDQSFVRNLHQGSDGAVLCEAIIVMGHKLGLKVIAEGIETREQRDLLAAAGCDYGQGYLFAPPMLPDRLEAMLDQQGMGTISLQYLDSSGPAGVPTDDLPC